MDKYVIIDRYVGIDKYVGIDRFVCMDRYSYRNVGRYLQILPNLGLSESN